MRKTSELYELRKEFCKDLCTDLVIEGDRLPNYPEWALQLSLRMVRRGWRKEMGE